MSVKPFFDSPYSRCGLIDGNLFPVSFGFVCLVAMKMTVIEWNLDLTKCQGTGEIGSLYRGFVISNTSLKRICGETAKMFVISLV